MTAIDPAIVAALTEGRLASEDLTCDLCGDLYDPACGCQHDGRQWCPACLTNCSECRDAIQADSWEN